MRSFLSTSLVVLLATPLPFCSCSTCYYPAGNRATNDTVCQPLAGVSTCCSAGYACLGNLLCESTAENTDGQPVGTVLRGSCTDKTFASPECPRFCTNSGTDQEYESYVVTCSAKDGTYCCSGDTGCSCDTGFEVITIAGSTSTITVIPNPSASTSVTYIPFVAPTPSAMSNSSSTSVHSAGTLTSSTTSTSQTSTTSSSTSESGASSTNTTAATHSTGSSEFLYIGLGVGIPLGVIALTLVAYMFWRQNQKMKNLKREAQTATSRPATGGYHGYSTVAYQPSAPEKPYSIVAYQPFAPEKPYSTLAYKPFRPEKPYLNPTEVGGSPKQRPELP